MPKSEKLSAPFTLSRQTAKVAHLNVREEKHGEEPVAAVDVKITADVSNDFLSGLSPTLKWSLYDKPAEQDLAEQGGTVGHMPVLRYPKLSSLDWDCGKQEVIVTLHGPKKKDDVVLQGPAKGLRLDCKDGGTVAITFQVQINPLPELMGTLTGLLGRQVKVSVRAGEAPEPSGEDAED